MSSVAFLQLVYPRHMDIYVQNSKHKSQNTEVTSFEHRTQNICIQNTMSHIGFRTILVITRVRKPICDIVFCIQMFCVMCKIYGIFLQQGGESHGFCFDKLHGKCEISDARGE